MRVVEIFESIDGEVNRWHQGRLTAFIRLAGCNLRCPYCDTPYAQEPDSGVEMTIQEIVDKLLKIGCSNITITGGEPLLQADELIVLLLNLYSNVSSDDFYVSVETNGSLLIPFAPNGVLFDLLFSIRGNWIVDFKLPSSGHMGEMKVRENFLNLSDNDWIKFVIYDYNDYQTAIEVKQQLQSKGCKANFAFSPVIENGNFNKGGEIVEWLKRDKQFDAVFNLQLHKILNIK